MRIIDQPNHPHYGPVRRMWVICEHLQLNIVDWEPLMTGYLAVLPEHRAGQLLLLTLLKLETVA